MAYSGLVLDLSDCQLCRVFGGCRQLDGKSCRMWGNRIRDHCLPAGELSIIVRACGFQWRQILGHMEKHTHTQKKYLY